MRMARVCPNAIQFFTDISPLTRLNTIPIVELRTNAEEKKKWITDCETRRGWAAAGNFDAITDEQWANTFNLTLMSAIRATRRALPSMRKNHWGRIVNFASSSIKQPLDNLILSNTYRAGIAGLSKSLAIELAPYNILVNTLEPRRIATDRVAAIDAACAQKLSISIHEVEQASKAQIPMSRYGSPDEFASMAVFLGSAANGYITGQAILVDGGLVKSL